MPERTVQTKSRSVPKRFHASTHPRTPTPGRYELFHYRDLEKREIDFLIEREDNGLLGIEIKAGSAIDKNNFKHMKWFQNNLAKNKAFIGIILYTGQFPASFGNNLWAIPFGLLWS